MNKQGAAGGAGLDRKRISDALDKHLDKAVAASPSTSRGSAGARDRLVVPSSVPKGRCSEGDAISPLSTHHMMCRGRIRGAVMRSCGLGATLLGCRGYSMWFGRGNFVMDSSSILICVQSYYCIYADLSACGKEVFFALMRQNLFYFTTRILGLVYCLLTNRML